MIFVDLQLEIQIKT